MINSLLSQIKGYNVLVVGDGIVDQYTYVKPQGKSPKENIITYEALRSESFLGGVWAAANHVKGFCESVDIWSGNTATTKRRYVEETYLQKVASVYETHPQLPGPDYRLSDYDLVIVTDFGHGCISPEMIPGLCSESRFLAVNAQTNSANHGFNLITKYPHADYVVIDELEARLAAHDRESPIEVVIEDLGFKRIIVTLGPNGSIGYDGGVFARVPAVSHKIVDTMGAGDAFFCVTAPFAAAGADIETLCRIGNAAGAVKCGVVGHRQPVTKEGLLRLL
jgi:bifunctional ADP-heptose synthase (sugar kinase/adenylyltransferase)